jgi:hypothetical protein
MAVNSAASGGTPQITGAICQAAQCAAPMFPHAAAANHSIFYDVRSGMERWRGVWKANAAF